MNWNQMQIFIKMMDIKRIITVFFASLLIVLAANSQTLDWYSYWGSSTEGSQIEPVNLAIDYDSNLYVAALFGGDKVKVLDDTCVSNSSTDKGDGIIIKLSPYKTKLWQKSLAGTTSSTVEITKIVVDNNNNLVVAGTFTGSLQVDEDSIISMLDPNGDAELATFVIRYDSDGNMLNMWQLPAKELNIDGVAIDSANNILISGIFGYEISFDPANLETTIGTSSLANQFFIAKYTSNGTLIWSDYSQSSTASFSKSIVTTDDSANVYIGGTYTGTISLASTSLTTSTDINDLFILKLSSDGSQTWAKRIGGSRDEDAMAIETSPIGDVAICCNYYSEDITITGTSETYDNGFVDLDGTADKTHLGMFTFKQQSGNYRWWYSFGAGSTTGSGQAEGRYLRCTNEGVWYVGGEVSYRYGDLYTYDNFGNYKSGIRLVDSTWVQHNTNGGDDALYLVLNREGKPCSIARPGGIQTERIQDVILSPDKSNVYMLYNINVRNKDIYTCVDNLWDSYTDITNYSREDDYTLLPVFCPEEPTDGAYSSTYSGLFSSTIVAKYKLPQVNPNELPDYSTDSTYEAEIVLDSSIGTPSFYTLSIPDELTFINDTLKGVFTTVDSVYNFGFTAIDSTSLPGTITYYAQDSEHKSIRGNSRNVRYMSINPEKQEDDEQNNTDTIGSDTLRFATYNIRIETDDDEGNKAWSARKQYVATIIDSLYSFDIFGVQEMASLSQQSDLMDYLDDYSIYSKGRASNGSSGERIGIVYKTNRFNVLDEDYFYLSETPEVQSRGWDGKLVRMCVWIKFYDKITNQKFYYFATHFDHKGDTVRRESAKLIISEIKEITADDYQPVILVGDFNLSKTTEITAYNMLANGILSDSKTLVSHRNINGPTGTSNGQDMSDSYDTESNRIDFIFVDSLVSPTSYYTIDDKFVNDAYPSDHFPVMITCLLNQSDSTDTTDNSDTTNVDSTNTDSDSTLIDNSDSTSVDDNDSTSIDDSSSDSSSAVVNDNISITSYAYFKNNMLHVVCSEPYHYSVFNLQGNKILSSKNDYAGETIRDAFSIPEGIYLIQIQSDNKYTASKIIK